MITQEQFELIEYRYGCGYWNVCEDHACNCSTDSAVGRGFSPEVYESMRKQLEQLINVQIEEEYYFYSYDDEGEEEKEYYDKDDDEDEYDEDEYEW